MPNFIVRCLYPRRCMGLVYLPTFTIKNQPFMNVYLLHWSCIFLTFVNRSWEIPIFKKPIPWSYGSYGIPSLKLTFSHLKMDGTGRWSVVSKFGAENWLNMGRIFRGYLPLFLGRVHPWKQTDKKKQHDGPWKRWISGWKNGHLCCNLSHTIHGTGIFAYMFSSF